MPSTAAPHVPPGPRSHTEAPYIYVSGQRVHSLHDRGLEVIQGLSSWAEKDLMRLLKPVESCWQPTDFLPDSSSPDFYDQVSSARGPLASLPMHETSPSIGTRQFRCANSAVPHQSSLMTT